MGVTAGTVVDAASYRTITETGNDKLRARLYDLLLLRAKSVDAALGGLIYSTRACWNHKKIYMIGWCRSFWHAGQRVPYGHYAALPPLVGAKPPRSLRLEAYQAGGIFTHMDHIWFYVYATPDYRDPAQRRGLVFRLVPGYIWVNQQGRRFHNEARSGGNSASPALMAQSPRHAWAIMDTPMTTTMEIADPYYRDGDKVVRAKVVELLNNSPFIRKADTLADLAKGMEVDVPTFLATIERYNKACEQRLEMEPEFGKSLKSSKAFDTPPYYAVQMFPLARKNFGGVKTDLQCRVLDKHFESIAGLYAAGEVAGMAGGHINGRAGLEGTMLGPSIFSGRVAGGWAAHAAGYGRGFVGQSNHS